MFELLHQVVSQHIQLSPREKRMLESAFIFRQVPDRFQLVPLGAVSTEFYFINKGLMRFYYEREGDTFTGFIFQEGLFASSFESLLTQQPSDQVLETLEPCDLLVLPRDRLMELYEKIPVMHQFTRAIVEQRFLNAQRILSSFILDSPEQRYRKFAEDHPDLLQRVPQHIIASCLGITPVSLSRIRRRIQEKEAD